jgi:hypothetical protein
VNTFCPARGPTAIRQLVNLPLWIGLDDQQQRVIEAVHEILAG